MLDEEKVKKDQNKHKQQSMARQRELDEEKVKQQQTKYSRLSRGKKREADHEKLKEEQNARQQKHRRVETANDRLREFKEATLYNAVFLCTCCQQRMFKSNVRLYTEALKQELDHKKPGLTDTCIENEIKTKIDGDEKCYVCLTCVKHMKSRKMPPMSAMNGMRLSETDKEIKDQQLEMTELEGALIAKNIIFEKIYQLPKSRWTALKDRVVNVPIQDDAIINTLEQLPRTPH